MIRLFGTLVLALLLRWLFVLWQDGSLTALSFWILGVAAALELAIVGVLLGGFADWENEHREGRTIEARRAAARLPRKRFG
jgi:hypothetical protein